jgi:hypothetical protein
MDFTAMGGSQPLHQRKTAILIALFILVIYMIYDYRKETMQHLDNHPRTNKLVKTMRNGLMRGLVVGTLTNGFTGAYNTATTMIVAGPILEILSQN